MKKTGLAISITFVVMTAGIALAGLVAKDREFSENENRYLASAPALTLDGFFSGEYQDKLETYLNDQIWLRDGWITAKTAVQKACGNTDIGGAYVGRDGYDFEKILPGDVEDALVNRNIRAVADYFDYCSSTVDSANLTFLLVPTSGLVLSDKLPDNAVLFDQKAYINKIAGAFGGYNFISPEEILRAHADEGVYYRTDHHWTTRGAFLTYQSWCAETGNMFPGEDAYRKIQVADDFRGSLYSKILDYDSAYDTIERMELAAPDGLAAGKLLGGYTVTADGKELADIYDETFLAKKDKYAYFLGGNYGEVQIINKEEGAAADPHTARNLLLVKDSFANAFVPFLLADYDNIYMIDLRYYNGNMGEYLEAHGITDVLVLYNVSNFISDRNIYKLSRGLQQG